MEESANTSSPDDPDPNPMPETATGQQTLAGGEGSSSTEAQEAKFAAEKKEKARVRFNSNAAVTVPPPALTPAAGPPPERPMSPAPKPATKPRPSALRSSSANAVPTVRSPFGHEPDSPSYAAAQERAREIAAQVRAESPWDSRASVGSSIRTGDSDSEFTGDDIPLKQLHARPGSRQDSPDSQTHHTQTQSHEPSEINEAQKIVQAHSQRFAGNGQSPLPIHKATPEDHDNRGPSEVNDGFMDDMYHVPPPDHYRGSILSQLLRLYKQPQDIRGEHHQSRASLLPLMGERSGGESRPESGTATPSRRKWYDKNHSQETLANLVEASTRLANPNSSRPADTSPRSRSPFHRRAGSSSRMSQYWMTEEARVTARIAEMLSRQDYLIKLCRALMLFGAPTHRLEEYLRMSARVLEVAGQFLYLPGCMIVSFDDKTLHTTEVRIVRTAQDIDLGKLKDVHEVYKEVMHDVIDVEEGIQKLDALLNKKNKFGPWARVLAFGLTSATCGPFSFKARLIDLPLIFCFGCLVGTLQLIVSPRSALYSNVFEVTSTIIVSFLARAFGSIKGGNLFCFSALAQSGIVMLLPGYLVLCSALEIQSHAIVPGSIRMVYAVIYSLLLGFGIMVGTALYGIFDDSATSATTCKNPIPAYWGFIFVPLFAVCISIIYQAKWRQMPVMVIMAFAGYIVNYFSGIKFVASPQIAPTLGALAVGLLANLWSRIRHGVAAATLIPAIFCQVPGGLASTGGLLSGLATADSLRNSSASLNGTDSLTSTSTAASSALNNMVFDVAARMIQIAIGISVGLFISALLVWPLGKRRSGLFSF